MNETSIAIPPSPLLLRFVEDARFKRAVVGLITVSAVLLGMETMRQLPAHLLDDVILLNRIILWAFVVELVLRIAAHRISFFRDAWNWFDFIIVAVSVASPTGPFQVLRALRILRALRLVSAVPSLKRVVDGLLRAVPGIASVMVLLVLLLYVTAVMATLLFRDIAPEYFGHLGGSLFSLFQIMTLEGWGDIANEVMKVEPWAWVFFVLYILIATFMVLNLVIGIVVSSIQTNINEELVEEIAEDTKADLAMVSELRLLQQQIKELREDLSKRS
jgi:voltage-gated sodium channel